MSRWPLLRGGGRVCISLIVTGPFSLLCFYHWSTSKLSLIQLYFTYAIPVQFPNEVSSLTQKLQSFQNSAFREATGCVKITLIDPTRQRSPPLSPNNTGCVCYIQPHLQASKNLYLYTNRTLYMDCNAVGRILKFTFGLPTLFSPLILGAFHLPDPYETCSTCLLH